MTVGVYSISSVIIRTVSVIHRNSVCARVRASSARFHNAGKKGQTLRPYLDNYRKNISLPPSLFLFHAPSQHIPLRHRNQCGVQTVSFYTDRGIVIER